MGVRVVTGVGGGIGAGVCAGVKTLVIGSGCGGERPAITVADGRRMGVVCHHRAIGIGTGCSACGLQWGRGGWSRVGVSRAMRGQGVVFVRVDGEHGVANWCAIKGCSLSQGHRLAMPESSVWGSQDPSLIEVFGFPPSLGLLGTLESNMWQFMGLGV